MSEAPTEEIDMWAAPGTQQNPMVVTTVGTPEQDGIVGIIVVVAALVIFAVVMIILAHTSVFAS